MSHIGKTKSCDSHGQCEADSHGQCETDSHGQCGSRMCSVDSHRQSTLCVCVCVCNNLRQYRWARSRQWPVRSQMVVIWWWHCRCYNWSSELSWASSRFSHLAPLDQSLCFSEGDLPICLLQSACFSCSAESMRQAVRWSSCCYSMYCIMLTCARYQNMYTASASIQC